MVSSFAILNSTIFDCSFIVASITEPEVISFLNAVKDLLSGALTVELYCCTPRKISSPKAKYIKNDLLLFFLFTSFFLSIFFNLILLGLKAILTFKRERPNKAILYIFRCNLDHNPLQIQGQFRIHCNRFQLGLLKLLF